MKTKADLIQISLRVHELLGKAKYYADGLAAALDGIEPGDPRFVQKYTEIIREMDKDFGLSTAVVLAACEMVADGIENGKGENDGIWNLLAAFIRDPSVILSAATQWNTHRVLKQQGVNFT